MTQYEICFIIAKDEDKKKVLEQITKAGAKILFEKNIGRRKFAYPIKKEHAGFYYSVYFELDNKKINQLAKNLQQEQSIARFLIVKNDLDVEKLKAQGKPQPTKTKPQKPQPALPTKKKKIIPKEKEIKEVKKTADKPEPIKVFPFAKATRDKVKTEPEKIKKETISDDEAERIKKLEEKLDELLKE